MATVIHSKSDILKILSSVRDPEIPVLTIEDMGIIRAVNIIDPESVEIVITPTYSGCPAMDTIADDIRAALRKNDFTSIVVTTVISPPWTTDWLTQNGKDKLHAYGIAPPVEKTTDKSFLLNQDKTVPCPRCSSTNTKLKSLFGSTPCKSLYTCTDCKEPFDYFKCH